MANKLVVLSAEVASLKDIVVEDSAPLDGELTQVLISYPDGTKGAVDVGVGYGEGEATWLIPSRRDTYLALNDVTPTFPLREPVKQGQRLWARMRNGDSANPHTITVAFSIAGK